MTFNTGGSEGQNPNDPAQSPHGGGSYSTPLGGPTGGPTGEFSVSDPVGSFVATVRSIILNPAGFFRGMPRGGSIVNPLVFVLICAVVYGVLAGIIGLLANLAFGYDLGFVVGSFFGTILGTPIGTVVGLFVWAGIFHLLVLLLVRPANAGFQATFRVVSYASVGLLVTWLTVIPVLGWLIGLVVGIYSLILSAIGIKEAHATTTGRAIAVVAIPAALLLVLGLLILLIVGAALLFGSQQL